MILILITNEIPHGASMSPFVSPNKGVRAVQLIFIWISIDVFLLFPPSIDFLPADGMWSNTNRLTDAHDRLQVIQKNTLDIKMIARVTGQVFWILIIPCPGLMTFIPLSLSDSPNCYPAICFSIRLGSFLTAIYIHYNCPPPP